MEPERDIEKTLREAAKRRRDEVGSPFEMHPATRRLLQGEVTRQFGSRTERPRQKLNWFALFWPNAAWVLAVFAALAFCATLLLSSLKKPERYDSFASNSRVETANEAESLKSLPATPPVATPAPAGSPSGDQALLYADADKEQREKDAVGLGLSAAAPADLLARSRAEEKLEGAPITAPTIGGSLALNEPKAGEASKNKESFALSDRAYRLQTTVTNGIDLSLAQRSPTGAAGALADTETRSFAAAAPAIATEPQLKVAPKPAAPPAPELAFGINRKTDAFIFDESADSKVAKPVAGTVTQSFAQAANEDVRRQAKVSAPSVLVSFQLLQNGRDLRIIDRDGSTYDGYVEAPSTEAVTPGTAGAAAGNRLLKAVPQKTPQQTADQVGGTRYFFRVVGTNRTLGERVVFSGNLVTSNTADANSIRTFSSVSTNAPAAIDHLDKALPLNQTRISGNLQLGGKQQLRIDAVPTQP